MSSLLQNDVDKRSVAAAFEKAAATYDDHDFLQREVAARAMERLDFVALQARRVLDLGSGTGRCAGALVRRYRRASVLQCDLAWGMLERARSGASRFFSRQVYVCADVEQLPLKDDAFDLAFANLSLQWCVDLGRAFREIHRVLEPGGVFVLADSVQMADSGKFAAVMENFRRVFHEPYYRDYIGDDIDARLSAAGFEGITAETHFMTRVWSARKPGAEGS